MLCFRAMMDSPFILFLFVFWIPARLQRKLSEKSQKSEKVFLSKFEKFLFLQQPRQKSHRHRQQQQRQRLGAFTTWNRLRSRLTRATKNGGGGIGREQRRGKRQPRPPSLFCPAKPTGARFGPLTLFYDNSFLWFPPEEQEKEEEEK